MYLGDIDEFNKLMKWTYQLEKLTTKNTTSIKPTVGIAVFTSQNFIASDFRIAGQSIIDKFMEPENWIKCKYWT